MGTESIAAKKLCFLLLTCLSCVQHVLQQCAELPGMEGLLRFTQGFYAGSYRRSLPDRFFGLHSHCVSHSNIGAD